VITNNQIKYLKQLQQKKCRDTEGLFLVEGIKLVNEAITYHFTEIKTILSTKEALNQLKRNNDNIVNVVPFEIIKRISALKTPQPAIAIIHIPQHQKLSQIKRNEIIIALDKIRDPGNLGTIIRLADWFGVENIICSKESVDCFNPKVVQASMGAIFRVKIHYYDLTEFLKSHNEVCTYGTMLEGENIYNVELELPGIILMGNESEGISKELLKYINKSINIPNFSINHAKSESLNVSIATSIALSEIRRKQHYSK
jgi:TrmH family RNA methyltransferase